MNESGAASGRANARAALLGNPSDGYGGKVIAFAFAEFEARVSVRQGSGIEAPEGAAALIGAALKRFARRRGARLPSLAVRCSTTIPREVGLGGSSAIVIATLRALCELLGEEIPDHELPSLALACETEELGIAAGLQDRVAQTYGGLVYMDLAPELLARHGHGHYEGLDPGSPPPLFVAWREDARQPSGAAHAEVRRRFAAGEPEVVAVMTEIAALAERGRAALAAGDREELGCLLTRNFELRRSLFELDPRHVRLVELARELGAPANYAGSGGAIVGLVPKEVDRGHLEEAFWAEGCSAIEPTPTTPEWAQRSSD